MRKITAFLAALALLAPATQALTVAPDTEMRSTWIATVWRLDWPPSTISSTGNKTQINSQKAALTRMLDSLAVNNFNAANLQIRSRCDAMYKSSYEPWSSDLVASRGMDPGYDPFEFFVAECHKRGLEAHAWLNPYRYESQKGAFSGTPQAYGDEHPDWIFDNGTITTLNPALPQVRQRICDIVAEIVTNYDLDGLLFDDYFYAESTPMSADAAQYNEYKAGGGTLSQADWRRDNVNRMIADVNTTIKKIKPWVRFGVGPAGLTCTSQSVADKHGVPRCTSGSEYQYNGIYSDPLAWLEQESIDYMSPQIYWCIGYSAADYDIICKWWSDVMPRYKRHLFVSHSISSLTGSSKAPAQRAAGTAGNTFAEYSNQVDLNRKYSHDGQPGSMFYSAKYLYATAPKFAHHLRNTVYRTKATVPPMTWFEAPTQGIVENLKLTGNTLTWDEKPGMRYVVYSSMGGPDHGTLLGLTYEPRFTVDNADMVGRVLQVAVCDRYGNIYARASLGAEGKPMAAPVLEAPANGAEVILPAVMSWKAVPAATSYIVQISTDPAMNTVLADHRVEGDTKLDLREFGTLPTGTYYWRVWALANDYQPGASEVRSFRFTDYTVTYPLADADDVALTPTMTWSIAAHDATLEIASDLNFASIEHTAAVGKTGKYTVPKYVLKAGTEYWVRVHGLRADGVTVTTAPVHFTTAEVALKVPAFAHPVNGGTLHADEVLRIEPLEGATALRVEVSTSTTFSARYAYVSDKVTAPTFADITAARDIKAGNPKRNLVDGATYYARARATFRTASGPVYTDYSTPISFVYSAADAGVNDIVSDAEVTITANALTVSAKGYDGAIDLYTADGTLVATGRGTVEAPSAGIYIVRAGAKVAKVTLR